MRNFLLKLTVFFLPLFFISCANQVPNDLKIYEQKANNYTNNLPILDSNLQIELDEKFNEKFFSPWHTDKFEASLEDITWQFKFKEQKVYGDNLLPIEKEWFDEKIANSNFQRYNTFLRKAITVKNSNLRVFPTESKIFYNPKKAGEGFPFDYNQNSGIKINTPLLISHFSEDRAYAYVKAPFAKGFIKVSDIAYMSDKLIETFENSNYFVSIKDNFPIYQRGIFQDYIKLGTIFPKKDEKLITIGRFENMQGFLKLVDIPNSYLAKKPLQFNNESILKITNELISEPYGWGEALNHRDCSAMTRDFFSPFGIYLNRNSFGQTFNGKYYDLSTLSLKDKEEYILKYGKPFLTLAYLKGHIMIYIGEKDGKALFFHNVWGVKTKDIFNNEARNIVGKAVISSLEMGSELFGYDNSKSLGNRVLGIVNLSE